MRINISNARNASVLFIFESLELLLLLGDIYPKVNFFALASRLCDPKAVTI